MDGLSAAASVIAVVQVSAQLFSLCQRYYVEVKDARNDIKRLRDEVTTLQDVLTNVADLVDSPDSAQLSILGLLSQTDGPLQQTQKELAGVIAKLEAGQGKSQMTKFGLRALKWPFSSKELNKLLETIGRHKATFNLALTADHIVLARAIKDDIATLRDGMAQLQVSQRAFLAEGRRRQIYQWLSPPDPSSNHNAACKKRQKTTGAWLLESQQFEEWKFDSNSLLWLYGISGCGKTVLSSTIVQHIILSYQSDSGVGIAYFYFDFNDSEKQRHENLLRSLIVQLSSQSQKAAESVDAYFARNQNGKQQPSIDSMLHTLQCMLGDFQQVFFILDALDECNDREELVGIINTMCNWKLDTLHILATSRRERDIEETLETLVTGQICIQSELVNADILIHIRERLQNDPKLRKWPAPVHTEIEKTLMDGAHGMFRWVVCQLDVLRKCLKLDSLRNALKSLPKTLDDTYARILCSIDEEHAKDAFKVLQWLVYSARPLRIEEVAEVLAVNLEEHPRFEPENRLREPRDILTICSTLVSITTSTFRVNDWTYVKKTDEAEELRLAHFSVKEYLVSDRIRTGPASQFAIDQFAEDHIAQICLLYLLYFDGPTVLASDNVGDFQLARYAAQYWTRHARNSKRYVNQINQLILELFQQKGDAYITGLRLFDEDKPWRGSLISASSDSFASPLYYAALKNLSEPIKLLLEAGANINAHGGYFGSALGAASAGGYEAAVKLLLENGADTNAEGGYYNTALIAASIGGNETIVKLLLDNGADVNAKGNLYDTALIAATADKSEAVARLLLKNGADINSKDSKGQTALSFAAGKGYVPLVKLLLEKGADMNLEDEKGMTPLSRAKQSGFETVVELLSPSASSI